VIVDPTVGTAVTVPETGLKSGRAAPYPRVPDSCVVLESVVRTTAAVVVGTAAVLGAG
jgi:hypothetical protein